MDINEILSFIKELHSKVQKRGMKNSFEERKVVSSEMCLIKGEWEKLAGYGGLLSVVVDLSFWYICLAIVYFLRVKSFL